MTTRILSISTAFVMAAVSPALATDAGVAFGAKTVGAMSAEAHGLATSADHVRRQGGFLTPGATRWVEPPLREAEIVPTPAMSSDKRS